MVIAGSGILKLDDEDGGDRPARRGAHRAPGRARPGGRSRRARDPGVRPPPRGRRRDRGGPLGLGGAAAARGRARRRCARTAGRSRPSPAGTRRRPGSRGTRPARPASRSRGASATPAPERLVVELRRGLDASRPRRGRRARGPTPAPSGRLGRPDLAALGVVPAVRAPPEGALLTSLSVRRDRDAPADRAGLHLDAAAWDGATPSNPLSGVSVVNLTDTRSPARRRRRGLRGSPHFPRLRGRSRGASRAASSCQVEVQTGP